MIVATGWTPVDPLLSLVIVALILFSAIRERVTAADVPQPFRGSAIALVTAGLMSLAFMGFSGLIKG